MKILWQLTALTGCSLPSRGATVLGHYSSARALPSDGSGFWTFCKTSLQASQMRVWTQMSNFYQNLRNSTDGCPLWMGKARLPEVQLTWVLFLWLANQCQTDDLRLLNFCKTPLHWKCLKSLFQAWLRDTFKKYLVTLSKKVGGGQEQITISGPLEIMTSLEGGRGMKNQCHFYYGHFWWYFGAKIAHQSPHIFTVAYVWQDTSAASLGL